MSIRKQTGENEDIEAKILHLLGIYPIMSPSMLQAGLGPYMKPGLWRPVLAQLIAGNQVTESSTSLPTPSGRHNTYALLQLAT